VNVTFDDAVGQDLDELAIVHNEAAMDLTNRFGDGHWSKNTLGRRLNIIAGHSRVRVGRCRGRIVTSLRLQTKKPWAIDTAYFTPVARPLYLTGMVVRVENQRRGLGRLAIADAHEIARAWPASAIRLDAYNAPAGAGHFYAKCGYTERGRVKYKGNPLIYYEVLLI
jgi:GNAT superfamily N-acetyltransferase